VPLFIYPPLPYRFNFLVIFFMEFISDIEPLGIDEFLDAEIYVDLGIADGALEDSGADFEVYGSLWDWLKPGGTGDIIGRNVGTRSGHFWLS